MRTATKVVLVACICIFAAAVAFFSWGAFGDHSETGFRRPHVDWLPPAASDISFYRSSNIANVLAYEFHIARPDFEALAREQGWPVKPPGRQVFVIRYTQCLPPGHPQRTEPFHAASSAGLFYENRRANGGAITVLYDDATSTAYVFQSNR